MLSSIPPIIVQDVHAANWGPPIPPAWPEGKSKPIPAKTIDEHIKAVSKALAKSLKGFPSFFLDGFYIELENELEDGSSPVDALFKAVRSAKIPFIPAVGLDWVEDYVDSVRIAIKTDGRGCCLRLVESDLESLAELGDQIDALLVYLAVPRDEVDLLLDFGSKVPQKVALPFLIDALPFPDKWRTLTIASSSFPDSMMRLKTNSVEALDREEWLAWLSIRSKKKAVKRLPTFSDYAINHPVLTEIDPRLMLMSPNIRYTDSLEYVVAKGQAQPRKKKKPTPEEAAARERLSPTNQYPKLAAEIKRHVSWKGAKYSWGDDFIDRCSRRDCVGSATDWRAVGTCHHIALVVQQLASLP